MPSLLEVRESFRPLFDQCDLGYQEIFAKLLPIPTNEVFTGIHMNAFRYGTSIVLTGIAVKFRDDILSGPSKVMKEGVEKLFLKWIELLRKVAANVSAVARDISLMQTLSTRTDSEDLTTGALMESACPYKEFRVNHLVMRELRSFARKIA
jgi:hypothetical protein